MTPDQTIHFSPLLDLDRLALTSSLSRFLDSYGNKCALTATASGALYQGILSLSLSESDVILCPAYNCGHEVEAIERAGVKTEFYSMNEDLRLDFEKIEAAINTNTRAILVTHFFGFEQPLIEVCDLCRQRNLLLIEDCAHCLPSEHDSHPGRIGDLAVFSIRKFLPVPDGGLLVSNNSELSFSQPKKFPQLLPSFRAFATMPRAHSDHQSTKSKIVDLSRRVLKKAKPILPHLNWSYAGTQELDFATDDLRLGASRLSKYVMYRQDWAFVREKRRENFRVLAECFDGTETARPIRRDLTERSCPLVFPIFCQDKQVAISALNAKSVPAMEWWNSPFHPNVDWKKFPFEKELKTCIIALPIHQDLVRKQLDKMVGALQSLT